MLCCGGDVIDFIFADSRPTAKPNLQSNLTKTHNLVQFVKLVACTTNARVQNEPSSSELHGNGDGRNTAVIRTNGDGDGDWLRQGWLVMDCKHAGMDMGMGTV